MIKKHSRRSCGSRELKTVFIIGALLIALSAAGAVVALPRALVQAKTDFAAIMTQAKLQADLGNHRQAAEAFGSIVRDVSAPAALRREAMVRLGLALSAAGDVRASKAAFKEARASSSANPQAFRFLTYAVARAVPGKIWPDFRVPIEELLKTAEMVSVEELVRGDMGSKRVYLKKDEFEMKAAWRSSRPETAAYELDKILGLDMVPPTVDRVIEGRQGSLQLWINGCKDFKQLEGQMPATSDWNHQIARMNLFDALIGNPGRPATNVLVDPNWEIILIDHLLAFSSDTELRTLPSQFDRRLVAKLRVLRENELQIRLNGILNREDIRNILKRRDALLAYLAKLVAERGEAAVLF
jgi:hypothetical protein